MRSISTISGMRLAVVVAIALSAFPTLADVGGAEIPGTDGDGPITVFYPSSSQAQPLEG